MKVGIEQGSINPPLELKKAQDILFASFYFSQGSQTLQDDIFMYPHRLHPSWHIDNNFPWQLIKDEKFKENVYRIVLSDGEKHPARTHSGQSIYKGMAQGALLDEAHALVRHLNNEVEEIEIEDIESDENLVATLTWEIIDRDHRHLIEKGGRPRGAKNAISKTDFVSPYEDPYLSHFCYYVMAGNSTGDV